MKAGTSFILLALLCGFIAAATSGCVSGPPPAGSPTPMNETRDLAVGEGIIIDGPEGSIAVSVRAFNAATGEILIEEKNNGPDPIRYNPALWVQDENGTRYTTVYCLQDVCPGYVFLVALPPGTTQERRLFLHDTFHIPAMDQTRSLSLHWSVYGQEVSWALRPA